MGGKQKNCRMLSGCLNGLFLLHGAFSRFCHGAVGVALREIAPSVFGNVALLNLPLALPDCKQRVWRIHMIGKA